MKIGSKTINPIRRELDENWIQNNQPNMAGRNTSLVCETVLNVFQHILREIHLYENWILNNQRNTAGRNTSLVCETLVPP
jgi:hypothetical protein